MPRYRFIALLFLTAPVLAGCGTKVGRHRGAEVDRPPRLEVVLPARTSLVRHIELACTVEAMEKADLCARVPGVVEYLSPDIDIGRHVTGPHGNVGGEKLIHLAVPDLEAIKRQKEALLDQARKQRVLAEEALTVARKELAETEAQEKRFAADFKLAKLQHERISELARRGSTQPERAQETERQAEAALAAWQSAQAQIETRKAKIQALDAEVRVAASKVQVAEADVHTATVQLGYATIAAPFDGVITKRWVDRGATVKDAGAPLLTVMRTDVVRVLLDIPERDVPLVNATEGHPNADGRGDPVTVRIPALAETVRNGEFGGTITRLASALDMNTRTMRAEVHLPNKDGHLKPGMSGSATVILEKRDYILTVPATALSRQNGRPGVYIVADPTGDPPRGVVKRVEVELGLDDGISLEVRGGLSGKELVILKGNGVVRQGDKVIGVLPRE